MPLSHRHTGERAVALAFYSLGILLLDRALGFGMLDGRIARKPHSPQSSLETMDQVGKQGATRPRVQRSKASRTQETQTPHKPTWGWGRGGGAVALRLPQPCRPETGPTPLCFPPPCHQCNPQSPMAHGVVTVIPMTPWMGSGPSCSGLYRTGEPGGHEPSYKVGQGGTVGPCLCLAEFPTSHVEVGR